MRNDKNLIPTRRQVEGLQVGDLALDCAGNKAEVVEILGRGKDAKGRAYVKYVTRHIAGVLSQTMTAGCVFQTM